MQRYVSAAGLEANLIRHRSMVPDAFADLQRRGMKRNAEIRLGFSFLTNVLGNAKTLKAVLRKRGYDVGTAVSAKDDNLTVLVGLTTPLKMSTASVVQWTDRMCRFGFDYDCEFDGWGTNPHQWA